MVILLLFQMKRGNDSEINATGFISKAIWAKRERQGTQIILLLSQFSQEHDTVCAVYWPLHEILR